MKKIRILLTLAVGCLVASSLHADKVYFKNGRLVEGEIISETGESVTMKLFLGSGGDIISTHRKTDIDRIEKGPVQVKDTGIPKAVPERHRMKDSVPGTRAGTKPPQGSGEARRETLAESMSSSFVMGVVADFFLVFLAITCFKGLKMEEWIIIQGIEKASKVRIIGRWIFIAGVLFLTQCVKFGNLDFIGSGWASVLILVIIIYETTGLITLLFFRKAHIELARKLSANPLMFKLPLAVEFLLFCYLFIMDLSCFF